MTEKFQVGSGWKLVLTYDGTDFHGWQVQPGLETIQGTLADAIERITGERVLPQGSGRTDAGVHALGQVASFALVAPIPATNFHRALNRALPASIRVLEATRVSPDFHARHKAVGKRYEYRIFRGEICPPWIARYVYALNWPLNMEAMREAAAAVVGEHDFASFAASDPDLSQRSATDEDISTVKTIFSSSWDYAGPDLLVYRVHGSGFLHHMVRNLVGTFLDVGRGQVAAADLRRILEARSRTAAGATAPARGLFLVSVDY
ncbi:MAG TPA: tRNA pseudouridine(38-40) synthase TruA [Alloacidobacterium sp.]|nr:tRNA pseudouridine(38-40) synthase TruA [Alloacidobacterium sp.]